jgi:hypothetical protein
MLIVISGASCTGPYQLEHHYWWVEGAPSYHWQAWSCKFNFCRIFQAGFANHCQIFFLQNLHIYHIEFKFVEIKILEKNHSLKVIWTCKTLEAIKCFSSQQYWNTVTNYEMWLNVVTKCNIISACGSPGEISNVVPEVFAFLLFIAWNPYLSRKTHLNLMWFLWFLTFMRVIWLYAIVKTWKLWFQKMSEGKSKASEILILSTFLDQKSSEWFLRKKHSNWMLHIQFLNPQPMRGGWGWVYGTLFGTGHICPDPFFCFSA